MSKRRPVTGAALGSDLNALEKLHYRNASLPNRQRKPCQCGLHRQWERIAQELREERRRKR